MLSFRALLFCYQASRRGTTGYRKVLLPAAGCCSRHIQIATALVFWKKSTISSGSCNPYPVDGNNGKVLGNADSV